MLIKDKIWTSWNKCIKHKYNELYTPTTEYEICSLIKNNTFTVRVIGQGKSSHDIVGGSDILISLEKYNQILNVCHKKRQITVQAGIILDDLFQYIEYLNWELPTLPDIKTISLGGAISTGTHGSGIFAQNLSNSMIKCNLIVANGDIITVYDDDEFMNAVRVSIGVLGILSTITLQCVPKTKLFIKQYPLQDNVWIKQFYKLVEENHLLRILWLPHTEYGYIIEANTTKNIDEEINNHHFFNTYIKPYRRTISKFLYNITYYCNFLIPYVNTIIQKMFFNNVQYYEGSMLEHMVANPRKNVLELSEWTIPLSKFLLVFHDLKKTLTNTKAYAHIPMDIRIVKQDNTYISNAYGNEPIVTIGCITRDTRISDTYVPFDIMQTIFLKYGGRPHWAKKHTLNSQDFNKLYPKWEQFITLRRKLDPHKRFLTTKRLNIMFS